jgi:hypothetical protein
MTIFTRQHNKPMTATASAIVANGHVRSNMGLGRNSSATIKNEGHKKLLRRAFIRI